MGREAKLLLGLLGLLAGVFVGVLSLKLFVPRPPDGAGPDIHVDHGFAEAHQVVEPPALAPRAWDFAAAPPLVPDRDAVAATDARDGRRPTPLAADDLAPPLPVAHGDLLPPLPDAAPVEPPRSRFAIQETAAGEDLRAGVVADLPPAPRATDAAPESSVLAAAGEVAPAARFGGEPAVTHAAWDEPLVGDAIPSAVAPSVPEPPDAAPGSYTVQAGDSWWSIAERAYGDGRFYRAVFAWNRVLDPRIALAPGTTLEIPPLPKLEAAWPKLLPPQPR